jgi:hypothetical protein
MDGGLCSLRILLKEILNVVLACMKMTEQAFELVCSIINICRDSEAELAPAMVRSLTGLSEYVNSSQLGNPLIRFPGRSRRF